MVRLTLVFVAAVIAAATDPAYAGSMDDLVQAAKEEGELTVIALPHDWCGWGRVLEIFKERYGLAVNELNPEANSGVQIEALKANRGNKGPQAPDVVELGLSFGVSGKAEGLFQPYKVSTWDTIPDSAKDEEGYWVGDSYGVLAFEVNADIVKNSPQDWSDLLKPEYAGFVALAGSPLTSNMGMQSAFAAGLSKTGGDPATAPDAGLEFFAKLNAAGNLVPANGTTAALAQGTTPIIVRWDFLALTDRDMLKGNPRVEVVVPQTGVLVGIEVQAISGTAPHPNAAKLWMELVFSDEIQLNFLAHYCHPARFNDLLKNGKIPPELLAKLPPAARYESAFLPTVEELSEAKNTIVKKWNSVVGPVGQQ